MLDERSGGGTRRALTPATLRCPIHAKSCEDAILIEYSIPSALIALGIILLGWSRGLRIESLNLLVLGRLPLNKPIEISARPLLLWPSLAAFALGASIAAAGPIISTVGDTINRYRYTPIENMPAETVDACKKDRTQLVGEVITGDSGIDHFLYEIINEYKDCAREIDYDNTGPFVEKYLAAVDEPPGEGWVAAFISWAMVEAGLDEVVDISTDSAELRENFRRKDRLIEGAPDRYVRGDIVFIGTREDVPNAIFPTVLIDIDDQNDLLTIVSGNAVNHHFKDVFSGQMVAASRIPKDYDRIDSVGRFRALPDEWEPNEPEAASPETSQPAATTPAQIEP
jgi:hypothetical protein